MALLFEAAETLFLYYISRAIVKGRLTLDSPTGIYLIPDGHIQSELAPLTAKITVHTALFYLRILTSSSVDLTFAEAYVRGEVSSASQQDLVRFFQVRSSKNIGRFNFSFAHLR